MRFTGEEGDRGGYLADVGLGVGPSHRARRVAGEPGGDGEASDALDGGYGGVAEDVSG